MASNDCRLLIEGNAGGNIDVRVARLTFEMIKKRPAYWNLKTIKKWLTDQGFNMSRKIIKRPNWKEACWYFIQSNR